MRVKKFRARSVAEAMALVKVELGADAVILQTAQVRVGGFFGLFGTQLVEVTAVADRSNGDGTFIRPAPAPATVRPEPQPPQAQAQPQPQPQPYPDLRAESVQMKAMVGLVMDRGPNGAVPGPGSVPGYNGAARPDAVLQELQARLRSAGIEPELAAELAQRVGSVAGRNDLGAKEARQLAAELIRRDLDCVEPIRVPEAGRRVIALVGPTGVGKTTTLAKLAAHFVLGRRLKVALVTSDTYRVAAVEQLRTYADILGVPLEIAYDSAELEAAVARHRHRDLVLVDTAGRSPRNEEHMQELYADLESLKADEIYLVLSMASSDQTARRTIESYRSTGFRRIIFTKWDEADTPGLLYNIVQQHRLSLSYVTNGQNVPDDIEVADPAKITRAIIGE